MNVNQDFQEMVGTVEVCTSTHRLYVDLGCSPKLKKKGIALYIAPACKGILWLLERHKKEKRVHSESSGCFLDRLP